VSGLVQKLTFLEILNRFLFNIIYVLVEKKSKKNMFRPFVGRCGAKVYQSFIICVSSRTEIFFFVVGRHVFEMLTFRVRTGLKLRERVGGNSETEGRHGALGFGVDGQVMIWSCSPRCGLSTGFI
jgi:hypothetical protein